MSKAVPGGDHKAGKLQLLYTNCNGLLNKLDELKVAIDVYNIDIVCVVETWLHKDINNAEVHIPGFNIFRQDRNFNVHDNSEYPSERGGSIIYIRSSISGCLIGSFVAPDSVAVELDTDVGKVVVACIYRSQSLSTGRNSQLLSAIKKLCVDNDKNELIIVGDTNLPNVSWIAGTVDGPVDTVHPLQDKEVHYYLAHKFVI